jgi:drug/metabolite transporter (DMT)-like permease
LIAARSGGAITLTAFTAAKGHLRWPEAPLWPLVSLNAVGDIGGNAFYILAGQAGRLDVAAVLGSLYPGTTVILAWLVLHERLTHAQWIGVLAALGAIVLMTV